MRHLFIPDTQVQQGVPIDHLAAAMNYAVEHKPDVIIHIGDHWDMPSLSTYEQKGSKYFEGKRYLADIEAGAEGMEVLLRPLWEYNAHRKAMKMRQYKPRLVFCKGNHENRVTRAVNTEPKLQGLVTEEHFNLEKLGWEVHEFLEIVNIDGIRYSHYIQNPMSVMGAPLSGSMDTMLKNAGFSFSMGHQQTLKYGVHYLSDGSVRQGLVAGSFYQHDEAYRGHQGNQHWRGCVLKNEVRDSRYDPCFLSIEYLLRRWT